MANIFLFTGENHSALQEKLRHWEKSFIEKHTASNLDRFETVTAKDLPNIVNALETEPFLAEKRMIILKGLPASSEKDDKLDTEQLEKALESLSEATVLIFVSPKPDKRSRLFKLLSKIATIESFDLLQGAELKGWISQQFGRQGKKISSSAVDLLIFLVGQEPARLGQEIEKLCLLEREEISNLDVEACVPPTPEAKLFKTLDMIGNSSPRAIMKSLDQLARSGEEMMMVFFMIVRQFRLLIQIRSLLDKDASPGEVQKRVKLAPFQVTMLSRQAKSFTMAQLKQVYRQLTDIDLQIKTGKIPMTGGNEELLQLRIDQVVYSLT